MIRQFHTPKGIIERELTEKEIEEMTLMGDTECKAEYYKKQLTTAKTADDKMDIILKFVGLKLGGKQNGL